MPLPIQQRIRNFCIIAHIDHGKSTLADRILEMTHTVEGRQMREQVLDQMDLERERGITIKASAIRLLYRARDGEEYLLNLIDTPGHVDFTYEVSRSLAAAEGAILVIDAVSGVEAQTVANVHLAEEQGLELIPVINKIDLANASPERARQELEDIIGLPGEEAILASAKLGDGVDEVLEAIVQRIPPPQGDSEAPLQALIFDSHFDPHRGIVAYVRVRNGRITPGMEIQMMSIKRRFEVQEVGVFGLGLEPVEELAAGSVGYVIAGVKEIGQAPVGETITDASNPAAEPLPGYRAAKPMVFCGIYPTENTDFPLLRAALEKLSLNDAALTYEPEQSAALGTGFRCGFLGLLHMEIFQERLEREYDLDLVLTAPSVVYRAHTTGGGVAEVDSPAKLPGADRLDSIEEPFVRATIMTPSAYVGPCMELCQDRRGEYEGMEQSHTDRVVITYILPLSEIILDFFDQLKSRTRGYASLDYEIIGYRESDLAKLDILINMDPVDALSIITHRSRAEQRGRQLVKRLRGALSRQMFEIRIQAALGSRIIAAERIAPLRKNVTAKCYGGDITRKRKLLEKQKEGKKRMRQIGQVSVPQEAFLTVLKIAD
ncbi:MAG TPA: translation elongation factor 4 [Armatimonadota bacterium]|nr:translation elongation factor 4 [Armatimonadota bacterium]